jgi:hypothetical protein
MATTTPVLNPELVQALKRLKLGRIAEKLPDLSGGRFLREVDQRAPRNRARNSAIISQLYQTGSIRPCDAPSNP